MAYTATLQTELQQVGYYEGPIDGIYGPATVEAVKSCRPTATSPRPGSSTGPPPRRSTSCWPSSTCKPRPPT